jgi:hypothetical protein
LRKGREVIEIKLSAMDRFAANVLEVRAVQRGTDSRKVLVMSERARMALSQGNTAAWSRLNAAVDQVLAVPVPTIENIGGGGVRCMLAEVPEITS